MSQPHKTADLARRDLLRLGLAGASMLVLGSGYSGYAGEMQMPGVERKVLKEVDSNIPGYAKIRVRDVIFQPGSSTATMTMDNDMICEPTEGTLEVTKDGQAFTAPKGTLWTCRKGGTEITANKGASRRHHARDRPPPRLAYPMHQRAPRVRLARRGSQQHVRRETPPFHTSRNVTMTHDVLARFVGGGQLHGLYR